MRGRTKERRKLFLVIVLVLATGLGVLAYATSAFNGLELSSVDARFDVRGRQTPPKDLVVVQIDDVTFDTLGLQWPFPRAVHAAVIDRIVADHPKVISYDVQFSERSATKLRQYATPAAAAVLGLRRRDARGALAQIGTDDDVALATAILDSGDKTVLSFTETDKGDVNFVGGGQHALDVVHGHAGNGLFVTDAGGVIRRVSYKIDDLKTLPVASYEIGSGKRVDPARLSGDGAWIDYYGGSGTIDAVSFSDVVRHKVPKGFFKDKWVVVGPSAPTLQDVHPTSTTGHDETMPGAEIQASALDTIRRGFPLRSVPTWVDILAVVLAGILTPLLSMRLRALWPFAIALLAGALYALASILLFDAGHIVALAYPLLTLGASAIGALAVHYMSAAFERERTRDIFSRFVPENVVDQVLEQTGGARLGGVARTATVMFSDLRGFTSFAESLPPDQVIEVLNRYLTAMVDDAIDPHGGTLVDYMGDGIMAVFGAPIDSTDHADRALAAARDKLRELEKFNRWLRDEKGFDKSFRMGIGLNTGVVTSGNVGSLKRMAYTTIGDTTNTAARLEGMTKGTPYMLFLSDSTRAALSAEPDDLVYHDEIEVRGRRAKVKIWSLTTSMGTPAAGETFQSVSNAPPAPAPAEPAP
ncbi:MAG TPA: adenylate/guanylate cyclase domain-containing protein [Solirubrobacteraceae bacterium]|nr:adenylate/guanylate cyclase domain-containing protein [Solirubrobacteraceae bacterium]